LTHRRLIARYGSSVVDEDIEREERAIYAIAIIALAPVVIVAALRRVHFDSGASLCLLFVVLAAAGLVTTIVRGRRQHLPRARIHEVADRRRRS
jgi:uncharacterized membrane protein YqjE